MLWLGHLGITLFVGTFLFLPSLFVAFGVLLPDMVDKGLFFLGLSEYGRLYAHNIFFAPIVSSLVYAMTRRKDVALAILFGGYMHLIEDARYVVPWFWPFVNYDLMPTAEVKIVLDTFNIVTESIGLSLLVILFVFKRNILSLRGKIWKK